MADPTTTNVLLAVPTRGSDPGTWDVPVNNNSNSLDGYLGGVVTVSLSSVPVTLTAPSGTPTPTAGPYQSQNRILKFTGALSGNVAVTLPLPGEYTIQNLTTGSFVVTFRAVGVGNIVSTPQGSIMKVWCDGTDVWLVKNQIPGALTFLNVQGVPPWIVACTIQPYLLCDGSVYNFSTYPALAVQSGSNFGGNGITTFGVPDLRGRVPIAFDGTGTRITMAGCGINGQSLGAAGGVQSVTLAANQIPTITSVNAAQAISVTSADSVIHNSFISSILGGGGAATITTDARSPAFAGTLTSTANNSISTTYTNGAQVTVNDVQPSQVAGIWLVAT